MLFKKKSQASKVVIYVVKDLENRSIIILFQIKTDKTKFNLIFCSKQFKTDVFSYECTNLFNLKHVSVCMPNISYIGF